MSINSAGFPLVVWDGLSPTRQSRTIDRPPDFEDWDTITAELLATQELLLQLLLLAVSVDGEIVAPVSATVQDGTAFGAVPLIFEFAVPDAAGAVSVTLGNNIRAINAWAIKTDANGGPGDTVVLEDGTNVLFLNVATGVVVRAGTIDPVVRAGGTQLRVVSQRDVNCACLFYVQAVKV